MYTIGSSYAFSSVVLHAVCRGQYLFACAWLLLTVTSVVHHTRTFRGQSVDWTFLADQLALYLAVTVGGSLIFRHMEHTSCFLLGVMFTTVTFCVILYFWGQRTNRFCFDACPAKANYWHLTMHCSSMIGHHAILLAIP